MAFVKELDVVTAQDGTSLRTFELSIDGPNHDYHYDVVTAVQVSTVGASIHKFLYKGTNIVLGYKSILDMYENRNPPYLAVIVGRVANRIAKGQFRLNKQSYQLDINNGPNHLHGGLDGFSHRVWDARIIPNDDENGAGVEFTLISPDGDQGYPGAVKVVAVYRLKYSKDDSNVILSLDMSAELLQEHGDDDDYYYSPGYASPINLAQHTYFNLAGQDAAEGILDHTLSMPDAEYYTPVDPTAIPTGQVVSVTTDDTVMDFCTKPRVLRDALNEFGLNKAGLTEDVARQNVAMMDAISTEDGSGRRALSSPNHGRNPSEPYGFDHNYVLAGALGEWRRAGIIQYKTTELTVRTTEPGVQLYTGNWLDGNDKIGTHIPYHQWQGICLETQAYPNGVNALEQGEDAKSCSSTNNTESFSRGKCFILRPGEASYKHSVEYVLTQREKSET